MIAGVILVAGASGKAMARVRKKAAERKIDFVSLLMVAITLMVTSAIVLPFSSMFVGGPVVNYLAAVFATLPIGGVAISLLAIAAALRD
ncbi:hypothetical protein [Tsukamurella tyrosinosolvens]|uniref:hypothetical protein n=1 Tax=Tsukamurella tyrosinosolvens TaxID=57704 RepID=UPI00114738CD|nr:hypothetical protein [Tsukamurella tyrosinosolvens]